MATNIARRALLIRAVAVGALVMSAVAAPSGAFAATLLPTARFAIVGDGGEIASFNDSAVLVTDTETIQYSVGANGALALKKLPGKRKPPTLTLKRGSAPASDLSAWTARKSVSLVMYNTDGKPVARYHLQDAWPSKLEVGSLLGDTVTLTCATIQAEPI